MLASVADSLGRAPNRMALRLENKDMREIPQIWVPLPEPVYSNPSSWTARNEPLNLRSSHAGIVRSYGWSQMYFS